MADRQVDGPLVAALRSRMSLLRVLESLGITLLKASRATVSRDGEPVIQFHAVDTARIAARLGRLVNDSGSVTAASDGASVNAAEDAAQVGTQGSCQE